jgi:hypothetical protein
LFKIRLGNMIKPCPYGANFEIQHFKMYSTAYLDICFNWGCQNTDAQL